MEAHMQQEAIRYVGFWARLLAFLIDNVLLVLVMAPIVFIFEKPLANVEPSLLVQIIVFLFEYIFPILAFVLFWVYRQASPGKMLIKAKIVDANTFQRASTGQYIGRYFAYYLSALVLFLGFIWIGFDARKQGWHDKLANTVVIYDRE
jgi:uncharacterized RDD family membrane protein YckC